MARTLLFLSADAFHASIWDGGELDTPQYFSNDANGRERFSGFLQQHRHPALLLVDVIEEDFRLETVPHLTGSARKHLLARKYEQFYRNTPFRQATLLQRHEDGRRDDEMLFSALTNPQRISPWLDILLAYHIPLIGIYSLPNISTPLVKNIPSDHVLLLSWEKDAGLRQTYYNNKRLHFSRLIPISGSSSFSESVATETPRTQQYLKSLSLPPAGEILDIHIICHAHDRHALQAHLENSSDLRYTYLDIQEIAQQIKAKGRFADSDATPLLLHLLAAHPPSAQYANSDHIRYYILWQLRRLLFLLAIMTTVASLLWSAFSFWQGYSYVADTEPLLYQKEQFQRQGQDIQSSFANTTVPAADMKTAVILSRQLNEYTPPPQDILRDLTVVLNNFAQIDVNKVTWNASAKDAAPSAYPAHVITFDGSLTGFGNDYRNALAYLDHFQQSLVQRGYTVSAPKLPMDLSSKGSISGEANKENQTQFTLQIIWRQKQ